MSLTADLAEPRTPSIAELMELAGRAAEAGARSAMQSWRRLSELTVETKAGPDDLVSQADRDAQAAICQVLHQQRPEDTTYGEEGAPSVGRSPLLWWVDPIDGTTSYLYGRPDWAVSVAVMDQANGRLLAGAVAEPALGRLTVGGLGLGTWSDGVRQRVTVVEPARALVELNLGTVRQRPLAGSVLRMLAAEVRDVRRGGSAAAALAMLATGRADGVWLPGLQPWDGAAGCLLAAEAGAMVGDVTGDSAGRWPASGDVLAAPERLWQSLRALLWPIFPSSRTAELR
jgi:myo-inositol-1(or 4)-monophosphatase